MGGAKALLRHMVTEYAVSLGREDPPARTAAVSTGIVPTRSGKGVILARPQDSRPHVADVIRKFTESSPLSVADPTEQRLVAGQLAVSFIIDRQFSQSTGISLQADAGWNLLSQGLPLDKSTEAPDSAPM